MIKTSPSLSLLFRQETRSRRTGKHPHLADGVRDVGSGQRLSPNSRAAATPSLQCSCLRVGVLEHLRSRGLLEDADQYRDTDALGEVIVRGEGGADLLGESGPLAGSRQPAAHR